MTDMTDMISYDKPLEKNPFTPEAGVSPPVLLDRERIMASIKRSIDRASGRESRTLIRGNRGMGKTVLLNQIEQYARDKNWLVISETAIDETLIADMYNQLVRNLQNLPAANYEAFESHITSVGLSMTGITLGRDVKNVTREDFRYLLTVAATWAKHQDAGLLITVDEVQGLTEVPETVARLAAVLQHVRRANLPVFFISSGLPDAMEELLKNPIATFLSRAKPISLSGNIPIEIVTRHYAQEFTRGGHVLEEKTLIDLATATEGFPYAVQLIGSDAWDAIEDGVDINDQQVRDKLLQSSQGEIAENVWGAVWRDIQGSGRMQQILKVLASASGQMRTSDIGAIINQPLTSMSQYRARLIRLGAVKPGDYGYIQLPSEYLRAYILEQS